MPNLIDYISDDIDNLFFVTSLDTLNKLEERVYSELDYIEDSMYIKTSPDRDIEKVSDSVVNSSQNLTNPVKIANIDQKLSRQTSGSYEPIVISVIQSMTLVSFAVSLIAIFYFTYISLNTRRQEIAVYRSLGMVNSQIFGLLMIELLILLLTSIVFGAVIGLIVVDFMVSIFFGFSGAAPPVTLSFPWPLLAGFTGMLIGMSILVSYVPIKNEANKQTGSTLRAE